MSRFCKRCIQSQMPNSRGDGSHDASLCPWMLDGSRSGRVARWPKTNRRAIDHPIALMCRMWTDRGRAHHHRPRWERTAWNPRSKGKASPQRRATCLLFNPSWWPCRFHPIVSSKFSCWLLTSMPRIACVAHRLTRACRRSCCFEVA